MWVIFTHVSKAVFFNKNHTKNFNFYKTQDLRQYNSINFQHRINTKPGLKSWGKTIKKMSKKTFLCNPSNWLRYIMFSRCPSNISLILKLNLLVIFQYTPSPHCNVIYAIISRNKYREESILSVNSVETFSTAALSPTEAQNVRNTLFSESSKYSNGMGVKEGKIQN